MNHHGQPWQFISSVGEAKMIVVSGRDATRWCDTSYIVALMTREDRPAQERLFGVHIQQQQHQSHLQVLVQCDSFENGKKFQKM